MSSVGSCEDAPRTRPVKAGATRLELALVTVSDVDRAKEFYAGLGRRLDADLSVDDGNRVVQLTPDYGSFASFSDPDGNGSLMQERKARLPGR